jgi:hypothetical protein
VPEGPHAGPNAEPVDDLLTHLLNAHIAGDGADDDRPLECRIW